MTEALRAIEGERIEVREPPKKAPPLWPGILSSGAFIKTFKPPDYLVEGLIQRRSFYSLTGTTGSGKTGLTLLLSASVATGRPFAGREVAQGRVLYLAGENPTDVQMRWDAMAAEVHAQIAGLDVHFIPGIFNIKELSATIQREVDTLGGAELVVIDTSAAYFLGDEENSNVQLGAHALCGVSPVFRVTPASSQTVIQQKRLPTRT